MEEIVITGVGSAIPPEANVLTNFDMSKIVDTSDEWIITRTGVKERLVAPAEWASSNLIVIAILNALQDAGLTTEDIDAIIISTTFPDKGSNVPCTSEIVKHKLKLPQRVLSLEENKACAGFCFALERARLEFLGNPSFRRIVVASGDIITKFTDYTNRGTCVLFGDAGGAVVLERVNLPGYGLLKSLRGTLTLNEENGDEYLYAISIPAGGSAMPANEDTVKERLHYMVMTEGGGKALLKVFGGEIIPKKTEELVDAIGLTLPDTNQILPHQANFRIIDTARRRLEERGLRPNCVFADNIRWYGNNSGSSVPLALDTVYRQNRIKYGDYLVLWGYGAGLVYAANLIRWAKPPFTGIYNRKRP
jgi:3-oxoacyl-[acyl-carrier-protein] synthase-3